ncbi:hypothetical protein P7C70_g2639, partial [Phenoliferia sp. Uapishka_3]
MSGTSPPGDVHHALDSTHPMDPIIARQREEAAREKAANRPEEKHLENLERSTLTAEERKHLNLQQDNINARLENPLAGISRERLMGMGRAFAKEKGLEEYTEEFEKGALIAQDPLAFESLEILNEEDKRVLRREVTHRWHQPKTMYFLVIACSMAAAVQGMDESVTNGANLFWAPQFGLDTTAGTPDAGKHQWLLGLVAGSPYLACAVLGCWLTAPLNDWLGRRGTIFLTALISGLTCIWSGCVNSWGHLFAARFVLGLGIGPKSATVPVYAAETAPPMIRGALVMQWQVWTAFGIMFGTASSLAFYKVKDPSSVAITGLNWRLMLGSACLPAIFVCAQVYFCPESPRFVLGFEPDALIESLNSDERRWLMSKGRYVEAYASLCRLRWSRVQAARDLFFIHALLEEEAAISTGRSAIVELFMVARNRRAALATGIVMFMQQFCGINVSLASLFLHRIVFELSSDWFSQYYSSTVFREAGFDEISALGASLGFGALNWVGAAPAMWTIDTFGRRALLLTTFPLMGVFLLMTGFAFWIPASSKARISVVALGIYLHCLAYSPGEGPVP